MIERIAEMPPGTIGLRAAGKLTKADYENVLEPALQEGIGSGALRLLFVIDDFDGLEPGAMLEDMKTGFKALIRDHSAWKRLALVTDVDWISTAFRLFSWMTPGEVRILDGDGLDEAKAWVAN